MKLIQIYKLIMISLLLLLLTAIDIYAQPPDISKEVRQLLENVQPVTQKGKAQIALPKEPPRYSFTSGGYLSHLGAPPSHYFPVTDVVPGRPEETATNFIKEYSILFGIISPAVEFKVLKSRKKDSRNYVRFEQTYAGFPVFGAQVIVQLNELDGVEYVTSDIAVDVEVLDKGILPTVPTLSAPEAIERARNLVIINDQDVNIIVSTPLLKIFDPLVVGNSGSLRLVWDMDINSEGSSQINKQILLDAHTGEIVSEYPLKIPALSRDIFDSNNTTADPGTRTRSDVQNPPGPWWSGIVDVDNAYDFLGHTYNFYLTHHGRDSINGSGMTLSSTVRYCDSDTDCPSANAYWWGNRLYFGNGWAADDVVGHEYTHGVTQFESNLIYANQSGAINESFSDIWGEFIDLTNGTGTDTPAVRWLIGEDTGDAIRSLSNPILYFNPDRMGSIFYYNGTADNGGVHTNSGVGNKLAYLLTDGESFNGHTVTGMGIDRVADLYYEVNANLLTSGANYENLCDALTQAATNLGWTHDEKANLDSACSAVEIYGRYIYVDKSNWCLFPNGNMTCVLGYGGPYTKVTDAVNAANHRARLFIKAGSYNEQITINRAMELHAWDGVVTIGQ